MTATVEPTDIEPRTVGVLVEAKLREWEVPYEYVADFPIDGVRVAPWAQVREERHIADKDSLSEFRTQMANGAVYPPIVVMAPDVLVDGNHRYNAAKLLRLKTFPAFVATFPRVEMAQAFVAALNQQNGRRLSPDEAFTVAMTMFEMGLTDEAISREIGRTPENVRQYRRRKEFAERTAKLKIEDVAEPIKDRDRVKLATIGHDPVLAKAVDIAGKHQLTGKQVSDLVKIAEKAPSDGDAIDGLETFRNELAAVGPPPKKIPVPAEIRQARLHLGGLVGLAANPLALIDTTDGRDKSIEQWRQVSTLAVEVLRLYGT